jgi:hypothetical protein
MRIGLSICPINTELKKFCTIELIKLTTVFISPI